MERSFFVEYLVGWKFKSLDQFYFSESGLEKEKWKKGVNKERHYCFWKKMKIFKEKKYFCWLKKWKMMLNELKQFYYQTLFKVFLVNLEIKRELGKMNFYSFLPSHLLFHTCWINNRWGDIITCMSFFSFTIVETHVNIFLLLHQME